MTTHVNPPLAQASLPAADPHHPNKVELGLLAVGLLALYIPTYIYLDKHIWSIVGQGHGPVMLALTMWLAWQRFPQLAEQRSRPRPVIGGALIAVALLFYMIGRVFEFPHFDTSSQIPMLVGILLLYWGVQGAKVMWFPIFFLLFLVPLPGPLVDAATAPLKHAVSYVAEQVLHVFNYPVGRSGVTLGIGQYKLLVADACAGLNSIFALEAIGVFYMSVVGHANKARNILLAVLILPISFVSNVLRVIVLVLVTYYFGDEAGQGFIHDFAGILLFMTATALTIGADGLLGLFFKSKRQESV